MKKVLFIIVFSLVASACSEQVSDKPDASFIANKTSVEWDEILLDKGTVNYGETVEAIFNVKNTGNHPLMIAAVKPSCGCTVAEYTEEAILPGETGYVKAMYDTQGTLDQYESGEYPQAKSIDVSTNTDPAGTELTLKVNVKK